MRIIHSEPLIAALTLPAAPDQHAVIQILVFAAVFVLVLGIFAVWESRVAVAQRLQRVLGVPTSGKSAATGLWYSDDNPLLKFSKRFEKYLVPSNNELKSKIRLRLVQAGYLNPSAVKIFFFTRFLFGAGLPLAFGLIRPLIATEMPILQVALAGSLLALTGLMLPPLWISLRTRKRQRAVREALPDALDLLLVCVEAGLGLDAALTRVSDEIGRAHPILADQFRLTSLEIRAGKSRDQALRAFADRTGLDEVQAFVTLLVQSEMLGASMGQTLRVFSDEMRSKRVLRAEEKAHALPVKLAVPLVTMIMPALLIVMLSPAIIRIVTILLPILKQGTSMMPQ